MPDCLFYHKGKKTQHYPLFFSYQPGCGQKKKATTFIVAFCACDMYFRLRITGNASCLR